MSNVQLYLAIGLPLLLVLLAWVANMVQMSKLGDRIDRLAEQQHKDILMLMEQIVKVHERISAN